MHDNDMTCPLLPDRTQPLLWPETLFKLLSEACSGENMAKISLKTLHNIFTLILMGFNRSKFPTSQFCYNRNSLLEEIHFCQ